MNSWELIFQQSRVNNGPYQGDQLPGNNWRWPQGTWFQTRLYYLRKGSGKYSRDAASGNGRRDSL